MPVAPDGVPAFMSPEFCNFIALAAEWMGGLSGAEQYVRFIAKWGVGSNGGEVETLRCFRWAAYVADEGVLMVGTLEMRNVRAYQGSNNWEWS